MEQATENKRDPFWDGFEIPFQEEAEDFDFINAVVVSKHFIKAISLSAEAAEKAEVLTIEIANKEVELARIERDLALIRRDLLAENYAGITKSASSEIQEAFILKCATGSKHEQTFRSLEKSREEALRFLEIRKPRLEQLRARLKHIENKMNWAQQYLNFEKILMKVTDEGKR